MRPDGHKTFETFPRYFTGQRQNPEPYQSVNEKLLNFT